MKALAAVCILAGTAAADDDVALHSQVGFGATVIPDRVAVTTEGGYIGGAGRFEAHATAEATLLPGLSVFTSFEYGDESAGQTRPAIGLAYQFLDPRTHPVGVRLSTAYKPDGFDEPEGELESSLVLSHVMGRDVVRTAFTAGTDPDGGEGDYELAASYLHRTSDRIVLGVTTKYRHALYGNAMVRWDWVTGALVDVAIAGRWRVEALGGVGAAQGRGAGPVGPLSLGIDL
jgi:hypothetical protein